jgi:hypothetical protein
MLPRLLGISLLRWTISTLGLFPQKDQQCRESLNLGLKRFGMHPSRSADAAPLAHEADLIEEVSDQRQLVVAPHPPGRIDTLETEMDGRV